MSDSHHSAVWTWRSREPAQSPPNPNFPNGVTIRARGTRRTCKVSLQYPAPGVGSWLVKCHKCGRVDVITAAGRRDDPISYEQMCWI